MNISVHVSCIDASFTSDSFYFNIFVRDDGAASSTRSVSYTQFDNAVSAVLKNVTTRQFDIRPFPADVFKIYADRFIPFIATTTLTTTATSVYSCLQVRCPVNSYCVDLLCVCNAFFIKNSTGTCVDSTPAQRSYLTGAYNFTGDYSRVAPSPLDQATFLNCLITSLATALSVPVSRFPKSNCSIIPYNVSWFVFAYLISPAVDVSDPSAFNLSLAVKLLNASTLFTTCHRKLVVSSLETNVTDPKSSPSTNSDASSSFTVAVILYIVLGFFLLLFILLLVFLKLRHNRFKKQPISSAGKRLSASANPIWATTMGNYHDPDNTEEEWWDRQVDEYYDSWNTPVPDPFNFFEASLEDGSWYVAHAEAPEALFVSTMTRRKSDFSSRSSFGGGGALITNNLGNS